MLVVTLLVPTTVSASTYETYISKVMNRLLLMDNSILIRF
jgi:hypothetical protein